MAESVSKNQGSHGLGGHQAACPHLSGGRSATLSAGGDSASDPPVASAPLPPFLGALQWLQVQFCQQRALEGRCRGRGFSPRLWVRLPQQQAPQTAASASGAGRLPESAQRAPGCPVCHGCAPSKVRVSAQGWKTGSASGTPIPQQFIFPRVRRSLLESLLRDSVPWLDPDSHGMLCWGLLRASSRLPAWPCCPLPCRKGTLGTPCSPFPSLE